MKFYLRTVLLAVVVFMLSCSKDDNNSTPNDDDMAEYTIIYYGCGGGNLDWDLNFNFEELKAMGYVKDVQFTGMYKYSTSWQVLSEDYEGTRLLTMEPNGELSNTRVGDADMRLDNPQTLADFIIDAKLRLPAKKYILIFNNHGSGFDIRDQLVASSYDSDVTSSSKIICKDDNTAESISIFEVEAALEIVGEKFDMLYWYACLMNAMENNYQIHEYFDYILGSNHVSYHVSFVTFINSLLKYDNLVDAGKNYAKETLEYWGSLGAQEAVDMTFIQSDKIEKVVDLVGQATEILCDIRDNYVEGSQDDYYYKYYNGDSSDTAKEYFESDDYDQENPSYFYTAGGLYHYYYDLVDFFMADFGCSLGFLSLVHNRGDLSVVSVLLNDAVDEMYLCRESANLADGFIPTVSVCLMSDVVYNFAHVPGSSSAYADSNLEITKMSELYPHLDFDKATGWGSKFLAGNVVEAINYDFETDTFYKIDR